MNFWVYAIDWRSRAIDVIAECATEREADVAKAKFVAALTKEEFADTAAYKTIAITFASDQMIVAGEQYRRIGGRIAV